LLEIRAVCFRRISTISSVEDNPARAVDALVDMLDLRKLGFTAVDPSATGRPGYQPGVLLKLYIYGYLNAIPSSRRLEREAGRNVELMWLTERLARDHKTIADFRSSSAAFRPEPAILTIRALITTRRDRKATCRSASTRPAPAPRPIRLPSKVRLRRRGGESLAAGTATACKTPWR
jgi:Transposase domain (DUF772)